MNNKIILYLYTAFKLQNMKDFHSIEPVWLTLASTLTKEDGKETKDQDSNNIIKFYLENNY